LERFFYLYNKIRAQKILVNEAGKLDSRTDATLVI